jgi:succinoglycan biosynthesis protein ExoA
MTPQPFLSVIVPGRHEAAYLGPCLDSIPSSGSQSMTPSTTPLPFLSVIVPCRNEAAYLGPCLDSILASGYPSERMEILIADGRSQDGTRELAQSYAARYTNVRVIDNPLRITPAALNRALDHAQGEIIARLDAHSTISPGYFTHAVASLQASGASNVGGRMRTVTRDRGPFAEPIRIALTSPFGVGNSRFRTGQDISQHTPVCYVDTVFGGCWPREVFTRIGGFNERLERSQDIEFNQRLRRSGGRILLTPLMQSQYYARATLRSFLRHNWDNGVWAVLPFAYAQGIPVRWRHLTPLVFVTALLLSLLFISTSSWPIALILIPYVAVSLAVSAATAWQRRRASLLILQPIAFWSLHLPYGAGSLWGALRVVWALTKKYK